ncbi:MAG TPA: peptide chain release factor N(5)-glutamine methyltransferase [Rudaea sp.]|nr:peptide chain release factor N(5)-glutamine methyltransferase [Rudaea sp.]
MAQAVQTLSADRVASEQGSSEHRRDAELLLMHALGRDRAWLYAHATDPVDAAIRELFAQLLARRMGGEPLAYVTCRREFWSLDLTVTPDVLIPRVETELLVEWALRKIPQNMQVEIADLGTGSGAIGLALASERPQARVVATDASAAALAVAKSNATRLGVDNVAFAHGNWCQALGQDKFDLIVSNPPYIAVADTHLKHGDLRFEPPAALSSGSDGMDAIRNIVRAAPAHLKLNGWLAFEHGFDQGLAVRELLSKSGFVQVFTTRDLEDRERVSGGQIL